jgi:L-rhamnose isomerase
MWHDKSAGGIERTNPGKNIRQFVLSESCDARRAALIFGKVYRKPFLSVLH